MFDIGFQELIVVFIVALLVVGPERLPEFSRKLGKWVNHIRSGINEAKRNMEAGFRGPEPGGSHRAGSLTGSAAAEIRPQAGGPQKEAIQEGGGEA